MSFTSDSFSNIMHYYLLTLSVGSNVNLSMNYRLTLVTKMIARLLQDRVITGLALAKASR